MGNWMNADGLYIEFGPDKAVPTTAGEYNTTGALREIEVKIDLTTLSTSGVTILADTTFFPKMRVEEIEIVVHTAAVGATATLNLGLIRTDRTTELDFNGFVAALPIGSLDAAGEKTVIRIGHTNVGALVGTTLTNVGYLTADADTAVFTAGVIFVRIRFYAA